MTLVPFPEVQQCSSDTNLNTESSKKLVLLLYVCVPGGGQTSTGAESVVLDCCVQMRVELIHMWTQKPVLRVCLFRRCVYAELRSASQSFHT